MGAIGLTGTKAKNSDGVMGEGYKITIGGSQSGSPTLGEVHNKSVPADQVIDVLKEVLIEKFGAKKKWSLKNHHFFLTAVAHLSEATE